MQISDIIIIISFFVLSISLPALLIYAIIKRFKKVKNTDFSQGEEGAKMLIKVNNFLRLLGFLLILGGFGLSVGPDTGLSELPLWVRVIIIGAGVALVVLSRK